MRKVMKWQYKTKEGNVIGHVCRLEDENELDGLKPRKKIIPYFKENDQSGRFFDTPCGQPEPEPTQTMSDEDLKKEMIRQTMSELGKRSAAVRAKKKSSI